MISLPCPRSVDAYRDGDNARPTRTNVRPWRAITTRALASSVGRVYIHFTGRRDAAHKKAAKMTTDQAISESITTGGAVSLDSSHRGEVARLSDWDDVFTCVDGTMIRRYYGTDSGHPWAIDMPA